MHIHTSCSAITHIHTWYSCQGCSSLYETTVELIPHNQHANRRYYACRMHRQRVLTFKNKYPNLYTWYSSTHEPVVPVLSTSQPSGHAIPARSTGVRLIELACTSHKLNKPEAVRTCEYAFATTSVCEKFENLSSGSPSLQHKYSADFMIHAFMHAGIHTCSQPSIATNARKIVQTAYRWASTYQEISLDAWARLPAMHRLPFILVALSQPRSLCHGRDKAPVFLEWRKAVGYAPLGCTVHEWRLRLRGWKCRKRVEHVGEHQSMRARRWWRWRW